MLLVGCGRTILESASPPDAAAEDAPIADDAQLDGSLDATADAHDPVDADTDAESECRPGFAIQHLWPRTPPAELPDRVFVSSTPLWTDFDADGVRELAFVATQHDGRRGALRIRDDDGRVYTSPTGELSANDHIAAGDLDGDGDLEIVAIRERWGMLAYDHRANELWFSRYPSLPQALASDPTDPRGEPPHAPPGTMVPPGSARDPMSPADRLGPEYVHRHGGAVHLADITGDGRDEVLFGGMVIDGEGDLVWDAGRRDGWHGTNDVFGPFMCVGDLTGDGTPEIVAGGQAFRADGTVLWGESPLGFCALADVLGDNTLEVVVVNKRIVRVLSNTGRELYRRRLDGRTAGGFGTGPGGPPAIGQVVRAPGEIVVSTARKWVVLDPTCETCEPLISRTYPVPRRVSGGVSMMTTPLLFDFGHDGWHEPILQIREWLMIGTSRRVASIQQSNSLSVMAVPIDLEGDDELELVVALAADAWGSAADENGIALARGRCEPLRGDVHALRSHSFATSAGFRAF